MSRNCLIDRKDASSEVADDDWVVRSPSDLTRPHDVVAAIATRRLYAVTEDHEDILADYVEESDDEDPQLTGDTAVLMRSIWDD